MGVLACSKVGCESVMCDTYVPGVGYVCRDCQERFKEWLKYRVGYPCTPAELKDDLYEFLSQDKSLENQDGIDIDEFFKQHTRV